MLIHALLPEKKHFKPVSGTERWAYQWRLIRCPDLRIKAKTPDIWDAPQAIAITTDKSASGIPNRITLSIEDPSRNFPEGEIFLEFQRGGVFYNAFPRFWGTAYSRPEDKEIHYVFLSAKFLG